MHRNIRRGLSSVLEARSLLESFGWNAIRETCVFKEETGARAVTIIMSDGSDELELTEESTTTMIPNRLPCERIYGNGGVCYSVPVRSKSFISWKGVKTVLSAAFPTPEAAEG